MQLSSKILLGMALGIIVGLILNMISDGSDSGPLTAWVVEYVFDVVGRIFIASLKLLVVPLVFVSLVCGSAAMGENVKMGRIAFKTLALYLFTTAVAITIALTLANIINPGHGYRYHSNGHLCGSHSAVV